jgi:hypothetical protein
MKTHPRDDVETAPCSNEFLRRTHRRQHARWLPLAGLWCGLAVAFSVIAFVVDRAGAQVPVPGLTVGLSGTNLQIVITNGSSTVNYEIYRTSILGDDENYPFTLHLIGGLGQTSFVASFGIETRGYLRAAVGSDWDGDGIANYMDAQPSSTNSGSLTITIDSPTNGTVIY